jgi:hypothetical protein
MEETNYSPSEEKIMKILNRSILYVKESGNKELADKWDKIIQNLQARKKNRSEY